MTSIIVETIGIYSTEHLAQHYKDMCLKDLTKDEKKFMVFEYREIDLDKAPDFILSNNDVTIQDEVDEFLFSMVKRGYLEQLVGEDGKFYYELTDKGKQEWPKQ